MLDPVWRGRGVSAIGPGVVRAEGCSPGSLMSGPCLFPSTRSRKRGCMVGKSLTANSMPCASPCSLSRRCTLMGITLSGAARGRSRACAWHSLRSSVFCNSLDVGGCLDRLRFAGLCHPARCCLCWEWWQRRRATIPLSTVKHVRGLTPRALRPSSYPSRPYDQTETLDDAHRATH